MLNITKSSFGLYRELANSRTFRFMGLYENLRPKTHGRPKLRATERDQERVTDEKNEEMLKSGVTKPENGILMIWHFWLFSATCLLTRPKLSSKISACDIQVEEDSSQDNQPDVEKVCPVNHNNQTEYGVSTYASHV
ncbi:hypothetical protein D5086_004441 [Populus alba]|uniref:Uncharacterized protein n=1 Tax=Populus alba TaxID=43335 RepID=A0ACC4CR64_POPAL